MITRIELADRVRTILDQTELTNPHEIADQVRYAMTTDELVSVVSVLLPQFVREIICGHRKAAPTQPLDREPSAPLQVQRMSTEDFELLGLPKEGPVRVTSWKHRQRWSRADQIRSTRIATGEGYIVLRDATVTDLIATAALREKSAAGTLREAQRYRDLAQALDAAGAKTVAELADSVVEDIFNAESASV